MRGIADATRSKADARNNNNDGTSSSSSTTSGITPLSSFPPPPLGSSATTTTGAALPPPPKISGNTSAAAVASPHTSTTQIPPLPSAPPSGNLAAAMRQYPVVGLGSSVAPTSGSTTPSLPPPPPPPPKRVNQTTNSMIPPSTPPRSSASNSAASSPSLRGGKISPLSALLGEGSAAMAKSATGAAAMPSSNDNKPSIPFPDMEGGENINMTTEAATDDITVVMSNNANSSSAATRGTNSPLPVPPMDETTATATATTTTTTTATTKHVRVPPTKPPALPYTAFASKGLMDPKAGGPSAKTQPASTIPPPILARRQEEFSVLIVATEAAHSLAWKNQLRLADLLTGLMQQVAEQQTQNTSQPLPPFRSVTRAMTLHWKDLKHVHFYDTEGMPLRPVDDKEAQGILHEAAQLQPSDGNLEQELHLLEDQVDHLLMRPSSSSSLGDDGEDISSPSAADGGGLGASSTLGDTSSSSNSNNNKSTMSNITNWHEQRQRQLDQVTQDAYALTSPITIPWLRRYRNALDHVTSHAAHDLTACPVLVLLVCTTQEVTNPLETLRALEVPHYLPAPFQNGLWNPSALSRHVLVLHDQVDGPKEWDETALRQSLTLTFGPTAALLRLNSTAPETASLLAEEEDHDLWNGGGKCGNCLSVTDRANLRKYLASLVASALLPALEKRLANLNAIVSERKKGVRNVLKSFWRTGKTKEELEQEQQQQAMLTGNKAAADGAFVRYRYDTIESQTRLLADTLFLVKDFENALSTYRLIRDDYKQDKAHSHYGSCQEMMALCMHHTDPYGRARDIMSCLETALLSYKKAAEEERAASPELYSARSGGRASVAPASTRAATRLCLVLTTSQPICATRHLEVADLLASASSNETALGAAVLLEQASAHYYQDEKYRKYSFHMLMSGHMFRTGEQEHHAFRCFTSALHIYRDAQWDELHNHIRSALAAQLYSMGRMALSLQLYAKLVGCRDAPRVSVKSQQKFVNHVLEICNEHFKKALAGADRMVHPLKIRQERIERITQVIRYTKTAARVLELPNMQLPYIEDDTVVVVAEEGAGGGSTTTGEDGGAVIGKRGHGDPDVWNQLMLESLAEFRSTEKQLDKKSDVTSEEVVTKVLSKIEDPAIRKLIAEIDKEKANRSLQERARKSASYKPKPPVRALMEPLAVEFTIRNPLGIPIDLVDLQVVARMTRNTPSGTLLCTNEDAIQITPLANRNDKRQWTFHSSKLEFSVPHFCRVSLNDVAQDGESSTHTKWKSAMEVDPYFVVTKTSTTLAPGASQTMSPCVCPLLEGDLEILGVRCRLFDDIWVYHPFSVKGELLQNTRSNRANRVRAESLVLKAKIECGMPCLTADLVQPLTATNVGDSGPLLQGQVSKWNLRLTNVGTAPAKSISVKTNLPWITIWDGGDEDRNAKSPEEIECEPTSYAVGSSGTLLRIPIDGFGLKVDGELQPGETVDVAVDLRTTGAGRQEFYMLFRYELVEKSENSSIQHRWLRKMLEVSLYPSIQLNASLIPSYSQESEHIVSVEVTNLRTDRPDSLNLLVKKIMLASRAYRLEQLPGQISEDEDGRPEVKLGWQERVTLHYRVIPLEEESSTCLLSQSNLSSSSISKTSLTPASNVSVLNFLCLERAHRHFEETWKSHQRALARAEAVQDKEDQHPRSISEIRRANTSASAQDSEVGSGELVIAPTSIRRLSPLESTSAYAVLVCVWKSEDGNSEGQHHIRGLPIRPMKESNGCPIVITGEHPSVVSNDFSHGPASVPLAVTLRNRLISHSVEFEFALERADDFDMSGPECFKWELAGGESLRVPLKAILPAPGVFNIQKIRLTIEDEEPVSYMFPLQWNVAVENKI